MENFENDIKRLEEIIRKLENGEAKLSESMQLFEEGVALTSGLTKKLDEAQSKIKILTTEEAETDD